MARGERRRDGEKRPHAQETRPEAHEDARRGVEQTGADATPHPGRAGRKNEAIMTTSSMA